MVKVQKYLERVCFAYGRREMPQTLLERGWDCAEAVELDIWMNEFLNWRMNFDIEMKEEDLERLFRSVAEIRHTAVRRVRTDSDGIKAFLLNAEELVKVLEVRHYQELISQLRLTIEKVINNLGEEQRRLLERQEEELLQLEKEQAKLDALRGRLLAEMDKDKKESRDMAGSEVWHALDKAEVTFEREAELEVKRGRWT